jgi:putative membrane protein
MRWINVIGTLHRTPIATKIWGLVVAAAVYYGVVVAFSLGVLKKPLNISSTVFALLGVVLSVLMNFRTNTAYDRWWEGRKLWGQLVNDSRNLAIKVRTLARADAVSLRAVGVLISTFAFALKEHLRGGRRVKTRRGFDDLALPAEHVPKFIANRLYEELADWKHRGVIDGYEALLLDIHLKSLMDICGACERIIKTPIPKSYLAYIRQGIVVYLLAMPWAFAHDLGFFAVPMGMVLAYLLIGLELIAEEIEEPFGTAEDDLRLDEICHGIEASVNDIVGLPPMASTATSQSLSGSVRGLRPPARQAG